MNLEVYNRVSGGSGGRIGRDRGLIAVWGREAVQFLNGMITNDIAKLPDGAQMSAAFPNAQGRLLAIVRVARDGDRFLFETEAATREKVFQNLFRFTFAGDFFAEDLSGSYECVSIINPAGPLPSVSFDGPGIADCFVPVGSPFDAGDAEELDAQTFEVLRIERGIPVFGVDCDETTIVPELGHEGLISYNKGCYIGQEIIARIHFRGHVAKRLAGLAFEGRQTEIVGGSELLTPEGKNAGRVTSVTFSPRLGRTIALGYVRYEHLAGGTRLACAGADCTVTPLPFV